MAGRSILSTILLLLLATVFLPVSIADNCVGLGCYICGKAVNKTPWTMLYTTNPGGTCKNSCCQVLNWNNGDGSWSDAFASKPSSKLVACTQKALGANQSIGGNSCSSNRVDVDAVTFSDRDFVLAKGGQAKNHRQRGVD